MTQITAERTNWEDGQSKLIWLPHKKTYEFAVKFCNKKIVLDVGCGQGWGTNLISKCAKKITGVDIDEEAIEFASNKFKKNNLKFVKQNLLEVSGNKLGEVDVVLCFQVIEHLEKPEEMLLKIKQIIKNKGILILSTPNKLSEHIPSPYHIKEYSNKELNGLLGKYFSKTRILGLYEGEKAQQIMDQKRKFNRKILRLDFLHLTNLLPLELKSKIFALGSKIVGVLVKKKKNDNFDKLSTKDFKILTNINNKASDLITICSVTV